MNECGSTNHLNWLLLKGWWTCGHINSNLSAFSSKHVNLTNLIHNYLLSLKRWLWCDLIGRLHFLSGVFRGGHDVLVRARLALADGVTMQVTVRSSEETVVDVILASVG